MLRLIHTADWQIGKSFGFAEETAQVLRDERLDAIRRLGMLAMREGAAHVLVAGDVYDVGTPSERTLRQPLERMREFPFVRWHLIPGNHDAHVPGGVWERLLRLRQSGDLPENVLPHLTEAPVLLDGAVVLPAVLTRRHSDGDPTAWMDGAESAPGLARIGLAHGSIADFGSGKEATPNRIDAERVRSAGLDYLALGDWHGQKAIGPRCQYSGTPEIDDFGVVGGGAALLVEIEGAGAVPRVTRHETGRFVWRREQAFVNSAEDIESLESRLRGMADELGTMLVWLSVSGALSLADRTQFVRRIVQGLGSALRVLRLEDGVVPLPTPGDLAAIDHAGFVRAAADALAKMAADESNDKRDIAAAALQRLYLLTLKAT